MPDISMCLNKQCPLRTDCYRFLAVPNTHQSYTDFRFTTNTDGVAHCDNFWSYSKRLGIEARNE